MSESEDKLVESLLKDNVGFKRLYDKHSKLKQEVAGANAGELAIDAVKIEQMKKEKLRLKDQMAKIIKTHKSSRPD